MMLTYQRENSPPIPSSAAIATAKKVQFLQVFPPWAGHAPGQCAGNALPRITLCSHLRELVTQLRH